jgi:hypothetical protein
VAQGVFRFAFTAIAHALLAFYLSRANATDMLLLYLVFLDANLVDFPFLFTSPWMSLLE